MSELPVDDRPENKSLREALGRIDDLSEREREVLDLLGFGMSNRDIARRLNLAESTVRAHVTRILGKLRVGSRLQAGLVRQLQRWTTLIYFSG